MFITDEGLVSSPADLVDQLECEHRALLNHASVRQVPGAPEGEPTGSAAEPSAAQSTVDQLCAVLGADVVTVDPPAAHPAALRAAAEQTRAALADGVAVIRQPVLFDGEFHASVDVLVSTAIDPHTGQRRQSRDHHGYEPLTVSSAHRVRSAEVLRLTAFTDALARAGHRAGPAVHLLLGDATPHTFQAADFLPLVRRLRSRLRQRLAGPATLPTPSWGEERPACAACRFARHCATGREDARDLSLVAGIRADQRRKLVAAGLATIDALAGATTSDRPPTLSVTTFTALRDQAAIQVLQDGTRTEDDPTGKVSYEIIDPDVLAGLPAPSAGDLFITLDGDPDALDGTGLTYLFGAVTGGRPSAWWAHGRGQERAAFQAFVDLLTAGVTADPDAHVYHYTAHPANTLKRLAARHGTREEAVDDLLRAGVLVDLSSVVRKALRISQRAYSLRHLEPLYRPSTGQARAAAPNPEAYQEFLAARHAGDDARASAVLADLERNNRDDCVSLRGLLTFLHEVRDEAGIAPLPPPEKSEIDSLIETAAAEQDAQRRAERAARLAALVDPLLAGLPEDPAEASDDERARALLAAAVGYHRRETNPAWWEFFRRIAAPLSDVEDDSNCVVPLAVRAGEWTPPVGRVRTAKRELVVACDPDRPHPFTTGEQVRLLYAGSPRWTRDARVRGETGTELVLEESAPAGEPDSTGPALPVAVLPGSPVRPAPKDEAVAELARTVVEGLPTLPAHPGIDLLRRLPPRLAHQRPLPRPAADGTDLVATVISAVDSLDGSTLAVQGPPGAGKTYLAARLITHLVASGKTVGVTSTSHKAVENVLTAATAAAREQGMGLPCAKRPKGRPEPDRGWEQPKDNPALARWRAEHELGHVVGGTAWTFANAALRANPFDVLVIDEAGQFALADALAVSTCARNLVLLGDPQQLPQVVQGTHPAGADASALGHLLGDAEVIPPHLGYFLDQSRRMHPEVCAPVSRLSYAGLLHAHPTAAHRGIDGVPAGLYLHEVDHRHNTTSSVEEADSVVAIARSLIGRDWTDGTDRRALTEADILVVAPYNLQVRVVSRELAKAGFADVRVGTVDRFQGQEAPVVVATMTSSATVDLPRGLDFLLSRNRLNVALSRAQAVAVLVCSPRLADADIRGIDQMRLVSGLLGLLDDARPWPPPAVSQHPQPQEPLG